MQRSVGLGMPWLESVVLFTRHTTLPAQPGWPILWARKLPANHKAADAAQVYSGIPNITLKGKVSARDIPIYNEGLASGIA
jgi:hypothetical protein